LKTRSFEQEEADDFEAEAKRSVDPIEDVDHLRNYQV
jgi:hypothetical protein